MPVQSLAQCLACGRHWWEGWLCGHPVSRQPCCYICWVNEWMRTAPCPPAEGLCPTPALQKWHCGMTHLPGPRGEVAFLEIQGCPSLDSLGSAQTLPPQACPPTPRLWFTSLLPPESWSFPLPHPYSATLSVNRAYFQTDLSPSSHSC